MYSPHRLIRLLRPERTFALVFSALASLALPTHSSKLWAQSTQHAALHHQYQIAGGSLDSVLLSIASTSATHISYDTDLVRAFQSAGVNGSYTVEQALQFALRGTPLRAQQSSQGQWLIQRQADLSQSNQASANLPQINVSSSFPLAATLTEHHPSYTTPALQIGSKGAEAWHEITQSVSVITQQSIEDQNLLTLADALRKSPGIATTVNTEGRTEFYARGFSLDKVQIDGGVAQSLSNVDLVTYDHIEILRGADGVYVGRGEPSGVVNLVRKRPTATAQYQIEAAAGSWNHYNGVLDASGPLNSASIRGRLIAKYSDKDFYYDTASERKNLLYGIVEADLSQRTLLTFGTTLERLRATPAHKGLPRYRDGSDIGFDRSTSFIAPWAYERINSSAFFLELDHAFNDRWSARLNTSYSRKHEQTHKLGIEGGVIPDSGQGPMLVDSRSNVKSRNSAADLSINGHFPLAGRDHEVTLGGSYNFYTAPDTYMLPRTYGALNQHIINVWEFDPKDLPVPESLQATGVSPYHARDSSYYGRLRFHLSDKLRLALGVRVSNYEHKMDVHFWDENGKVFFTMPSAYFEDKNVLTRYAGLSYDWNENLTLYSSYSDVYLPQSEFVDISGSTLKPIIGSNWELGAKTQWLDGRLQASISAYQIRQTNHADYDDAGMESLDWDKLLQVYENLERTGGHCCFTPSGTLTSRGVDLELTGELSDQWKIIASYNYNRKKWSSYKGYIESESNNSGTPKHSYKLWTTYRLPKQYYRWTLGFGLEGKSSNYNQGKAPAPDYSNLVRYRAQQGGYTVFNAMVSHRFNNNWIAQLNVNNLFDKHYYDSIRSAAFSNWYGAPRNFMLTLRGQF